MCWDAQGRIRKVNLKVTENQRSEIVNYGLSGSYGDNYTPCDGFVLPIRGRRELAHEKASFETLDLPAHRSRLGRRGLDDVVNHS